MKRILVVDDDEILRMLICDTLEDSPFDIQVAANGFEALDKLKQEHYHLLIIDYMMPAMTGIEVIKKIPEDKKAQLIILMLTAKAQDVDKQAALLEGATYFMPKPFSPLELKRKVEEVLNAQ